MGTQPSKLIDVTQVDLSQWKQIGIHREMSKIVQNTQGKGIAELQTITFNPNRDIQKEIQIYQYRKTQDKALVKCLGVVEQKVKNSSICGSNEILKVLTERIPFRLNQIPQLSFPETLYTLSQSLRGYKDCYIKTGSFDIDEQMIGINQQGDVKVWLHQNFAENHPFVEKPLLQTSGSQIHEQEPNEPSLQRNDQTDMVWNIIQVVQRKNEFGKFPQQFALRIQKKPLTFDQAFKQIENFVKAKNIFVPDRLPIFNSAKSTSYSIDLQPSVDRASNVNSATMNNPTRQLFIDQRFPPSDPNRISSPIIYNQSSMNNGNNISNLSNGVQSPIKVLFQQPTHEQGVQTDRKQFFGNQSPMPTSPRTQAMGSRVTFRLMSPQNSTLSFQNQNSRFINRI